MRADVVEYARDGAAHPVFEAFRRVDVNRTTRILASLMVNRIMGGKRASQEHEGFSFISHQVRARLDRLGENPIRFGLAEILDHGCPYLAGRRTDTHIRWPRYGHKCRGFQGFRPAFTSTPWRRIISIPPRLAADIEAVDLDHSIQGLLASARRRRA